MALLAWPCAAWAEGFAVHDLRPLAPAMAKAAGADFEHRAETDRVTLACPTCAGSPMIDVRLGRQADGTEQRVRSGETPVAKLEALCRAREPACRLTALEVAPAVGWITAYPMGSLSGATAVILRDGDLLTIRAIADDPATARRHAEMVVAEPGRRIVGR